LLKTAELYLQDGLEKSSSLKKLKLTRFKRNLCKKNKKKVAKIFSSKKSH